MPQQLPFEGGNLWKESPVVSWAEMKRNALSVLRTTLANMGMGTAAAVAVSFSSKVASTRQRLHDGLIRRDLFADSDVVVASAYSVNVTEARFSTSNSESLGAMLRSPIKPASLQAEEAHGRLKPQATPPRFQGRKAAAVMSEGGGSVVLVNAVENHCFVHILGETTHLRSSLLQFFIV